MQCPLHHPMDKLKRLNPELRSNFVAYLDGELSDEETQQVEAVLAQSEVARADMEDLARTYELLDVLPRLNSTENFTERTMETVRVAEVRPDLTQTAWYRAARRGAVLTVWVAGVFFTACVGFLITNRWVPAPTDPLMRDLPVIEQLDVYTEIDNFEFLQRLAAQDDLLQEMEASDDRDR